MMCVISGGSDQTARVRRLVWAFAVCACLMHLFYCRGSESGRTRHAYMGNDLEYRTRIAHFVGKLSELPE